MINMSLVLELKGTEAMCTLLALDVIDNMPSSLGLTGVEDMLFFTGIGRYTDHAYFRGTER